VEEASLGEDSELARVSHAADRDPGVGVFCFQLFPIMREVAVGRVRLTTVFAKHWI
jgi:hypothetical protein